MRADQISDNLWRSVAFELRQLRSFAVLAEELNFRGAAERLFISQPALSKQIAALERELGLALLRRDRRHVELTEAGRVFLADVGPALEQLERATGRARRAGGLSGVLRVGFPEYASQTHIPDLLARFGQRQPEVRLEPYELISTLQLRALAEDRLDFGLLSDVRAADEHGVAEDRLRTWVGEWAALLPLAAEPVAVALPSGSPLARQPRVALAQLAGARFILTSWRLRQHLAGCCQQAGFSPDLLPLGELQGYSASTIAQMVAGGAGVTLMPASQARILYPGVVFRPLCEPELEYRLCLCWLADRPGRLGRAFVAFAAQQGGGANAGDRAVP